MSCSQQVYGGDIKEAKWILIPTWPKNPSGSSAKIEKVRRRGVRTFNKTIAVSYSCFIAYVIFFT
jgi:hypothetical protein